MNIVVDTNVLISAVLWKGPPSDALRIIFEKHSLVQSESTIREFENVLRRAKFAGILKKRNLKLETVVETLVRESRFYTISRQAEDQTKSVEIGDVDDLIFVELALESGSAFILSGDKHLLDVHEIGSIRVLTAHEFLNLQNEK